MTSQKALLTICLAILLVRLYCTHEENSHDGPVAIVLLGATGDLSKKYLWKAIFDHYRQKQLSANFFHVYGATRLSFAEGSQQLKIILDEVIQCNDNRSADDCLLDKHNFLRNVQYRQLRDNHNYRKLCDELTGINYANDCAMDADGKSCLHASKNKIQGYLFYLAIPPFAFPKTAEFISNNCRPVDKNIWMRIVLEKPFGSDYDSAVEMVQKLSHHLREEEIFRIDHYLGKPVTRNILSFRMANKMIENKLNSAHVDRIEIKMLETLDVKGRTSFYDEYCVIRDVMQNHLTELLLLVTMNLPESAGNHTAIRQNKLRVLRDINPLSMNDILLGQYSSYLSELRDETDKVTSTCPTFAAAKVKISSRRWDNVPIFLYSGKKMKEKDSSITIHFKDTDVCVGGGKVAGSCAEQEPFHLKFSLSSHYISATGNTMLNVSDGWMKNHQRNTHVIVPSSETAVPEYFSLIRAVIKNEKHSFVPTDHLLASWQIWDSVLLNSTFLPNFKYYKGPTDVSNGLMDFSYFGDTLVYKSDNGVVQSSVEPHRSKYCVDGTCYFNNALLKTGFRNDVVRTLAEDIHSMAEAAVVARGVFHLALSGGKTPLPLFHQLRRLSRFPWDKTHVWLVDERCVPLNHENSNFYFIHEHLLKFIAIPYFNVHPMPVQFFDLCNADEKGDGIYSNMLDMHVSGGRLDAAVVGVGQDGHTASIFPNSEVFIVREEIKTKCMYTLKNIDEPRMSLTLDFLSKSRLVAALVLGKGKNTILRKIENSSVDDYKALPILSLSNKPGFVWYIDNKAL